MVVACRKIERFALSELRNSMSSVSMTLLAILVSVLLLYTFFFSIATCRYYVLHIHIFHSIYNSAIILTE